MKKLLIIILLLNISFIYAQKQKEPEYKILFKQGKYKKAIKAVNKAIRAIYNKRVSNKILPDKEYISDKPIKFSQSSDKYILNKKLFQSRKVKGFFIKDDKQMYNLHYFAAQSYQKLKDQRNALNNFYQALRYRTITKADHKIFYDIAQTYKATNNYRKTSSFQAYLNALEAAYTINPDKISYSLELAKELYYTKNKKRAIFHLKRYVENATNPSPGLYLLLGNLYEQTGKYLFTQKYYQLYLQKTNDKSASYVWPSGKKIPPGYAYFALGYLAYSKTGNHAIAKSAFRKALKLLSEKDIFRRSKSHEYIADIAVGDLQYTNAISYYLETIKYQDSILKKIKHKQKVIKKLRSEINAIKSFLLKNSDSNKFELYQDKQIELGKQEIKLRAIVKDYNKLNPGKVRWNIAMAFKKLEKYNAAMKYFRECISFDYNSNEARRNIIKIQLKLKRGY